jgi:glycerol-3-phosphate dehydrogenase (NAD(P)+)
MSDASPAPHAPPGSIAVLGAGAWGTALARLLARNGHHVLLWARTPEQAAAVQADRENRRRLPGALLPDGVSATASLDEAVRGADGVVLAVPVRATPELLDRLPRPALLVSCAKGFVDPSLTTLTTFARRRFPGLPVAALSGPNLAAEIGADLPAATTVAAAAPTPTEADALARRVQAWFGQASFRVYTSHDLVGVETSGAIKNVMAVAAGMSDALALGDNTKAALVTRGLAELVRIGTHLGGQPRTFYGLSGLGDLIATCASPGSRNHQAGERLARGATLAELEAQGLTAEGLHTVAHVDAYARRHGLDLPLTREVHAVVHGTKAPAEALRTLLARQPTAE